MSLFFFFNDTATTEIYTLSLHDALPISGIKPQPMEVEVLGVMKGVNGPRQDLIHTQYFQDRKSTRLNSSHVSISYAVFCLKKKKNKSEKRQKRSHIT